MKIKDLRAHFQAAGLDPKFADVVESQAQPCVRLEAIPTDENELPLGCSKIGGSPDLPKGASWPEHRGRPLDFLIQVDLQNFNQYPFCSVLPPRGRLYFFCDTDSASEGYDTSDSRNCCVIYHPSPKEGLERHVLPEQGETPRRFNSCRVVLHQAWAPGWHKNPIHALHLDEEQEDKYLDKIAWDLPLETSHQVLGRAGRDLDDRERVTQLECQFLSNGLLLGEDRNPVDEAKAREVAPGALEWRLLLQLDSDEGAGMDWGDSMISFWIREKDLRERNFSEVLMIEEWF